MIRALSKVHQKVNHACRLVRAGRLAPQASNDTAILILLLIFALIVPVRHMKAMETEQINDLQALQESPQTSRGICSGSKMNGTRDTALAPTAQEAEANRYRPFHVPAGVEDWVSGLELDGARAFSPSGGLTHRPKILVLYGSLRVRSFSRLLAYEFSRVLELLGAEVRVYDPTGLPMKDDVSEKHEKVVELRSLCIWSEGQMWVSPEQHGTVTGVFKNQIDWIPLEVGSVRPSQGRTLGIAQVNGGSQSFNSVNTLRVLGRWMRMNTIPNQSSVPKAWTEFDATDRMKPSSLRDRVVDVAEELYKFTVLLRGHSDFLVDRYSEREERRVKGRLLSQAEKEKEKNDAAAALAASAAKVEEVVVVASAVPASL